MIVTNLHMSLQVIYLTSHSKEVSPNAGHASHVACRQRLTYKYIFSRTSVKLKRSCLEAFLLCCFSFKTNSSVASSSNAQPARQLTTPHIPCPLQPLTRSQHTTGPSAAMPSAQRTQPTRAALPVAPAGTASHGRKRHPARRDPSYQIPHPPRSMQVWMQGRCVKVEGDEEVANRQAFEQAADYFTISTY